jgi:hypothetical protein
MLQRKECEIRGPSLASLAKKATILEWNQRPISDRFSFVNRS